MSEKTAVETATLELLVPPFADDGGDWQEILRLAGASRGSRESAATSTSNGADRTHRSARLRRPFWSVWRVGAIAACVAGLIALVAVWPFRGGNNVFGQALAAIGSGPLIHAVLEDRLGDQIVDLRTGRRTAVHGRLEMWYEPRRGFVGVQSFRGHTVATIVIPRPNQGLLAKTIAGKLITGYRAALRAGSFHVTGSGTVNGMPVYWIESKPTWNSNPLFAGNIDKVIQRVAISKTTYKPVFTSAEVNGHTEPASATRVVSIETLPLQSNVFTHHHQTPTTLWGTTPTSPAMTLAQARSSMQRQPLVPPVTIAGIHRSQIAEPAYLTGSNTNAHQIPGVRLIYGHVGIDRFGGATYNGPYISITEFPARNAAVLYQGLSYFPDANRAIIENTTATLKTHGLYIIINASDASKALAAAEALVRS